MRDSKKTKAQLVDELTALRQRVAQLEAAETGRQQVEEALGASEREFRGLVDNALAGIYRTNLKGDILYANEFLSSMLGFESPQEMMMSSVLDRYKHSKDREALMRRLEKEGQVSAFDVELLDKSGGTVAVLLSAALEGGVVTGMIMDITERKRTEEALRHRLAIEELVAAISTRFINLAPEQTDSEIGQALRSIGEFVGVDRSYFGLYTSDATQVEQEHEWFAQGLAPQSDRFQGMVVAPLRWSRERYRRAEALSVPRVADLPPEASAEKTLWQALGIKSVLTIPLFRGQALVGYLGFQAEREERVWSGEDAVLLRLAGEVFLNAVERRQAEGALRESEERFRAIFETARDSVFIKDTALRYVHVNPAMERLFGLPASQLIGRTDAELFGDEAAKHMHEVDLRVLAGEVLEEEHAKPVGGVPTTFHVIKVPMFDAEDQVAGLCGIARDITGRKRIEEKLQRSLDRTLLLNRVVAVAASTTDSRIVLDTLCRELAIALDVPQAAFALLEADGDDLTVTAEYRAEGRPSALGVTIPVASNEATQYVLEHRVPLVVADAQIDPRQAVIHDVLRERGTVSLLIVPLVVGNRVAGTLGLDSTEAREFTSEEIELAESVAAAAGQALERTHLYETLQEELEEHKRLEQEIEERRLYLESVLSCAPDAIVTLDAQQRVLEWNAGAERLFGYTLEESIDRNLDDLVTGSDPTATEEAARLTGQTLRGERVPWVETVRYRKDGSPVHVRVSGSPIVMKNEVVGTVGVYTDITEHKRMEAQLLQAHKMETVGQLAGGLAHDFNNLLTSINGFAELMLLRMSLDEPTRDMAATILRSGQRAADLVSQLLAFSRKQMMAPRIVNLNDVVVNMDQTLKSIAGPDVGLETILSSDLWPVKVDPTQFERVIHDLAINGRDAMPEGGRLTIETANVVLGQEEIADYVEVRQGDYVLLAVSDTGAGLSEEARDRVFEPFFVTSPDVADGIGLRMAAVYGIVKQNDGYIWAASQAGQGTTFKIYLPRASIE